MQYRTQALSRQKLRDYAHSIRKALHLDSVLRFPVPQIMEIFHTLIGDDNFYFECVEDNYFEADIHAAYYPGDNCIRVKQSVYESACAGNGRDRMTLVHEMAHVLLLKVSGLSFTRCFDGQDVKPYNDPEWHAKCLAAELMMPYNLVKDLTTTQITAACGVSFQAAQYQKSKFK